MDDPRPVGLLGGPGLQPDVFGRLGVVVEAEVRIGLVDRDGREVQVVAQEFRQEIGPLLGRHAQLEPVARAPRRQHEVIGRADVAGGEFLGDQAVRELLGRAGAAVLFRQHEGAEAELGALLQELDRDALLPIGLLVEGKGTGLDLLLREVARQFLKFPLLVGQSDIEHE